ncbi:hypothetical protein CYD30_28230 [Kosakonia cowanii]|nr:hypothetical protein CYD30_28230 [Kosakonia cowanii]
MNLMNRKIALTALAIDKLIKLSESEIEDILFSEYLDGEDGEQIAYESIYDEMVQDFLLKYYIEVVLYGVSNRYLAEFIQKHFQKAVNIVGEEPSLEKCPCCGYLTLTERGAYDICPVCHWEDDGKSEEELLLYSTVNNSTLEEYRSKIQRELESAKIIYKKG